MGLRRIVIGALIIGGSVALINGCHDVLSIDYDRFPSLKKEKEMGLELKTLTTDYPGSPGYPPKSKNPDLLGYNHEGVNDLRFRLKELKKDTNYVKETELVVEDARVGSYKSAIGYFFLCLGALGLSYKSKEPKK